MRNGSENQIDLTWIRHGETRGNQEGRYMGKTEEALSRKGRLSLLERVRKGEYKKVDFVFTSPMKRCIQTAGLIYPQKTPIVVEEWREIDFGSFEGKNYEELKEDKDYKKWICSGGTLPFPNGETREIFEKRCRQGLNRVVFSILPLLLEKQGSQIQDRAVKAAAIVHGGTIMAVLSQFCQGDYFDYQCKNGHGFDCHIQVKGEEALSLTIRTNIAQAAVGSVSDGRKK